MKKIILLLLAVFIIGILTWYLTWNALGSNISSSLAKRNNQNLTNITLGMPKHELIELMGRPERAEAYTYQGRIIEFMFYRVKGFSNYFSDNKNNFVPIAIENRNGLLLAWDWRFYNEVVNAHKR